MCTSPAPPTISPNRTSRVLDVGRVHSRLFPPLHVADEGPPRWAAFRSRADSAVLLEHQTEAVREGVHALRQRGLHLRNGSGHRGQQFGVYTSIVYSYYCVVFKKRTGYQSTLALWKMHRNFIIISGSRTSVVKSWNPLCYR